MKKRILIAILFCFLLCCYAYAFSFVSGSNYRIRVEEYTIMPNLGKISIVFNTQNEESLSFTIEAWDRFGNEITFNGKDYIATTYDSEKNMREVHLEVLDSYHLKQASEEDAMLLFAIFYRSTVDMIITGGGKIVCKAQLTFSETTMYDALLNSTIPVLKVGDWGLAGYVFYDKGYYSDGWRYLEAAPAIVRMVLEKPCVDQMNPWYDFGDFKYESGVYYEDSLLTREKKAAMETKSSIGSGYDNTATLSVYSKYTYLSGKALCMVRSLEYGGFDDWFLPSEEEMKLLLKNLPGQYPEVDYWVSTTYWGTKKLYANSVVTVDVWKLKVWSCLLQKIIDNEGDKNAIIAVRRF